MKNKNKTASPLPLEITATYSPSKYRVDGVLHAMLRYLILLTAVIGVGVSVSAMLGLKVDFMTVVWASVYTFTTFYLLFKSLRLSVAGIAFGFIGMLIALKVEYLTLKRLFVGAFNGIFNSILDIIKNRGYNTVPYLNDKYVTDWGMLVMITAIAALVVGLTCRKKTRVFPYVIVVTVPAVIFMMTGGSAQLRHFAPAVAAACAMAAMELAEKGVKDIFRSSFVGFTSFVLAAILMLTPIVNTQKAMDPVSFGIINGLVEMMTPDGFESNIKRSSRPRRRTFTGKKIMTVYTNTASPLYLRNWAGGTYDGDDWYSVDYDHSYSYADYVRENDYFGLTKKFIETAKIAGYDREKIGIGMTNISIVLAAKQKNLPLPSMSGRTGAIYDAGKTVHPTYIYDGVSTFESSWKGKVLTSAAVIDDYDNELLSDVIYGYFEYLVGYCGKNITAKSDIGKEFVRKFYKYGNDEHIELTANYTSFAKSAYGAVVTDDAIERAVVKLIQNKELQKYFTKTYFSGPKYDVNGVFYGGYLYQLSNYGRAHAIEVANIVADYLADGRKYTTNPKTTGKSVTEELLYGSKQGYCVQFATVGTLIMRKLGFYARYAEGYIVQNYKGSRGSYAYESKVTDREGHAWCEVWIDGFGWIPLEMTPGFGESNVSGTTKPPQTTPPETSTAPIVTTPPVTDTSSSETTEDIPVTTTTPPETSSSSTETTEPISEENDKGKNKKFDPVPIIVAAVILILLIALISSVVSTVRKKKKRLDALIIRALSANLNSEERRMVSIALEKALAAALAAYKVMPKAGELPENYGLRLEATLRLSELEAPLSLCVEALVKQVYGFGMDENDIRISALTLRALRINALRRIGIFKLIICKIKGVL